MTKDLNHLGTKLCRKEKEVKSLTKEMNVLREQVGELLYLEVELAQYLELIINRSHVEIKSRGVMEE